MSLAGGDAVPFSHLLYLSRSLQDLFESETLLRLDFFLQNTGAPLLGSLDPKSHSSVYFREPTLGRCAICELFVRGRLSEDKVVLRMSKNFDDNGWIVSLREIPLAQYQDALPAGGASSSAQKYTLKSVVVSLLELGATMGKYERWAQNCHSFANGILRRLGRSDLTQMETATKVKIVALVTLAGGALALSKMKKKSTCPCL
eukprot:gnl/Spiro4/3807_TR1882_c0_g1_i1.p1 gnl/Spiro4/3807_TR1882_c0_g1~~gnl/Spiro4/3807_TR1882_c0_g1_i1.p1  ORF type:complete len:215 (+),score=14.81 gnl/Spiro4/3807_TR1882_c0_g1_i1:42-647(+)